METTIIRRKSIKSAPRSAPAYLTTIRPRRSWPASRTRTTRCCWQAPRSSSRASPGHPADGEPAASDTHGEIAATQIYAGTEWARRWKRGERNHPAVVVLGTQCTSAVGLHDDWNQCSRCRRRCRRRVVGANLSATTMARNTPTHPGRPGEPSNSGGNGQSLGTARRAGCHVFDAHSQRLLSVVATSNKSTDIGTIASIPNVASGSPSARTSSATKLVLVSFFWRAIGRTDMIQ